MRNQSEPEQFEDLVIELGNKMVVLKVQPFDTDIDVDGMLKIDYHNVIGEILTFTVLFNRIGNLRAEQENIVSVSAMDMKVFEAQMLKEKRIELLKTEAKATEAIVDAAIKTDARYRIKYTAHYEKVKNYGYIDSLYWAAKEKAALLKVISGYLRPEEFSGELLTDTVNGVLVKASKKLI